MPIPPVTRPSGGLHRTRSGWEATCGGCMATVDVAGETEEDGAAAAVAAGWARWRPDGGGREQWRCPRERCRSQEIAVGVRGKRSRRRP